MTDRDIMQQALDALWTSANPKAEAVITSLTERLAQPEQEPVAWLDGPHLVVRVDMRDRLNYKGPWVDLGRAIPDKWTPLLYTTPPQRKPLTDEQATKIVQGVTETSPRPIGAVELGLLVLRAAETAHNIKEKNNG